MIRSLFFSLTLCLIPFALRAYLVFPEEPLSLDQLAQEAHIIAKVNLKEKRHEMLTLPEQNRIVPVVVYLFHVEEAIKGDVKDTIEVKQLNIQSQSQAMQLGLWPMRFSSFEMGKEYLLFLGAPNSLGLSRVLGKKNEGRFEVKKNAEGKMSVVNPLGNRGLLSEGFQKTLSKQERAQFQSAGPIPYADFTSLIRKALRD